MKTISFDSIVETTARLCEEAACNLPGDVCSAMQAAVENEESALGRSILQQCLQNADIAREDEVPICQDTGSAVYLMEVGSHVLIDRGTFEEAVNKGTAKGYDKGFLRKSIVDDPVFERANTRNNTPAIIHTEIVSGDHVRITLLLKGAGSENMSAVRMLKPSDGADGIKDFVVSTVVEAGGNPCPPLIVGIGIGGNLEYCGILAKKALARETGKHNPDSRYAAMEQDLLKQINDSGVGPQGLGGSITALAVHIEYAPCHMASLPVAVNINCHAARHISATLQAT
ncbi:MAG: fumarate hydratase [Verrucomicrobiota bacterium]